MKRAHTSRARRSIRHTRVRARVYGTATKPRLSIFRSNTHVIAQIIDDEAQKTIAYATDMSKKGAKKSSSGQRSLRMRAEEVGGDIAKKALGKNISRVVFDRGGYRYHGAVKAFADAARKGGLHF